MVISVDLITGILSFFVTLLILSYLIGDNPLFRTMLYIFIGASTGYVAVVAWWQVLWPRLILPLRDGTGLTQILALIPLLGVGLIFLKWLPRLGRVGSPVMAYLVGVGAAVALGGALTGTLYPQMAATVNAFDISTGTALGRNLLQILVNGGIILVGTVTSLAYFHFGAQTTPEGTARRFFVFEGFAWVGRIFIAIALGVIFAGVYTAALTAFIERISSLINFIGSF